jgi:N6-adenosine-specific RNA methylase IME4
MKIRLDAISIAPNRMRKLRPEFVDELAQSIGDRGLLQAVVVAPKGQGYRLIAGRHRVEAARKLGWQTIRADVVEGLTAVRAELDEIDENLIRADLSPAERALHLGRRKELYEREHPETRKGSAGGRAKAAKGAKSQDATKQPPAFIDDAAAKTGKHRATVARDVARSEKVVVLAEIAGTVLDEGAQLNAPGKLPPAEQRKLAERAKAGEKVNAKTRAKQIRRKEREETLSQKQCALPDQKFGAILEDFEWDFKVRNRETGMDRHAANHYETAENAHTPEEIVERTKERFTVAADDCVLFMWVPIPFLAIGIDVLRLRRFEYKSSIAWGKDKAGTGFWVLEKHEYLLIGVKGNIPCPAPGEQWESLQISARGRHSEKPIWAYELIEQYFPNLPKIELNARSGRKGWVSWGNEAPKEAAE